MDKIIDLVRRLPKYEYADGGRSKYFKGYTGDCSVRAAVIAYGIDYKEAYKRVSKLQGYSVGKRGGCPIAIKEFLNEKGINFNFQNIEKMGIHEFYEKYRTGSYIVQTQLGRTPHWVFMKDGVFFDTWDSRFETARGLEKSEYHLYSFISNCSVRFKPTVITGLAKVA